MTQLSCSRAVSCTLFYPSMLILSQRKSRIRIPPWVIHRDQSDLPYFPPLIIHYPCCKKPMNKYGIFHSGNTPIQNRSLTASAYTMLRARPVRKGALWMNVLLYPAAVPVDAVWRMVFGGYACPFEPRTEAFRVRRSQNDWVDS